MKELIEKIVKRIQKEQEKYEDLADGSNFDGYHKEYIEYTAKAEMCEELLDIIHEEAKAYNDGWIPCSERLPFTTGYYLVTIKGFNRPMYAWWLSTERIWQYLN